MADGKKVICIYHASGLTATREYIDTFRVLSGVVTLSSFDAQLFQQQGVKNAIHIPNFLTFNISSICNTTKVQTQKPAMNLITVSRVSQEKRLQLVIESFNIIHKSIPNTRLQIVGAFHARSLGKYHRHLKRYIRYLKLQRMVTFTGHTNPTPYYQNASLMLFTSPHEGFPLVISEAHSFSVPVVMMRLQFLANAEFGCVQVGKNDVYELALQSIKLLNDEGQRKMVGE